MGQVQHGSAATTVAVRRAIQSSEESLRALAKRYGINPKTVAKWKGRADTADLRTGPKSPLSTVLSIEEEAIIRGVPPPYIIAPGRLPLRVTGDDPASDALVIASLSSAPWDQPATRH